MVYKVHLGAYLGEENRVRGKKETKTPHMVKSNVLNLVMAVRASGVQSKERSLKVKCTLISLRGKDNTLAWEMVDLGQIQTCGEVEPENKQFGLRVQT